LDYLERAKEIIQIEIDGVQKVMDGLDGNFSKAVELILQSLDAGGKIVITGMGKSYHIGLKMAASLTSTGSPATTLHPAEAMHGDFGVLLKCDILLALSYSGASDELVSLVPAVKRQGIRIVSMTGELDSPMAQCSDVVIPVTVAREACPFNMAPTASTTAMLAVGDALAMVLLEARGFKREDYAKLHPGGAIGKSLLLRVSDIMRRDERMARVSDTATVKDAIMQMTGSRAGSAAVVDGDGVVVGILTDGDLRRNMADLGNIIDLPVAEVMTADPVTVTRDSLAVDVLKIFEDRNIDDIVVVDEGGRAVGSVDIQDLPKLKIM
jgi:arabinose-5-phosphate isomerase